MAKYPRLNTSSFLLQGGPVGVLMIHGFSGCPNEMRMVAEYLHERGFTVAGPCLPGHGTTAEDLNRRKWREWTAHVDDAFVDLQARCQRVFVGGFSLGALLALYLAAHRRELPGAVVYAPGIVVPDWRAYLIPIVKYLVPQYPRTGEYFADPEAVSRYWSYATYPMFAGHESVKLRNKVKRLLPQVACPLLIVHSAADPLAHPSSAQYVYDRVTSRSKELVYVRNAGHYVTVDGDWESLAERTCQFLLRHLSAKPEAA
jgi:carboxylesterase